MITATATTQPNHAGWTGVLSIDAAILTAKLSRGLKRDDWQDLMCIASMMISEVEDRETRLVLTRKLWR